MGSDSKLQTIEQIVNRFFNTYAWGTAKDLCIDLGLSSGLTKDQAIAEYDKCHKIANDRCADIIARYGS